MDFSSAIETKRLLIRLVREGDIADLLEMNGDPEVTRFLPYDAWKSLEDGEAWYERMCTFMTVGETLQFVIVELKSGRAIGSCLLFRYDKESARAEMGYVMGQAFWKQGYTHEALSALVSHAFDVIKLNRIEAEVDPANIASNNLLLKVGFTCEGRLRQRWSAKGSHHDVNIYGLLNEEWLSIL